MASPGFPTPSNNWLNWQYDPKPTVTWGSYHPSIVYAHSVMHYLHGQTNQFTHNPTWFIGDPNQWDVATAQGVANIKGWWNIPGHPYVADTLYWNFLDWSAKGYPQ